MLASPLTCPTCVPTPSSLVVALQANLDSTAISRRSRNCLGLRRETVETTYCFSLRLISTLLTTTAESVNSPLMVTEFSAAAFASSLSNPDKR